MLERMVSQAALVRRGSLTCGLLVAVAGSATAQASSFDLSTDFSYTNNPNGAWSFVYGGSALTNVGAPQSNGNSLIPAIGSGGYYSTGSDLNSNTPDVIKTAVDGSSASGSQGSYSNGDFLTGDVIVHSPNSGAPVDVIWTAPSNGTISFTTDLWYAHTLSVLVVDRTNSDSVLLGGNTIGSADISPTSYGDRSSPWVITDSNVSVSKGEELIVQIEKASGQAYGSLNGVEISGTFTAAGGVPEASTWAMMLVGFTGLGIAGYRAPRKSAALAV